MAHSNSSSRHFFDAIHPSLNAGTRRHEIHRRTSKRQMPVARCPWRMKPGGMARAGCRVCQAEGERFSAAFLAVEEGRREQQCFWISASSGDCPGQRQEALQQDLAQSREAGASRQPSHDLLTWGSCSAGLSVCCNGCQKKRGAMLRY